MSQNDVLMKEEVNNFANMAYNAIPEHIDEKQRFYLMFNLVLVKYCARPSTLIDNVYLSEDLLKDSIFINFLSTNDLKTQVMRTQAEFGEQLWIYNIIYENMFMGIENLDHNDPNTHKIVGELLGYPCAGYFFEAYTQRSLLVMMSIGESDVYGYVCPITIENIHDAGDKWVLFNAYANMLDMNLTLKIDQGLI